LRPQDMDVLGAFVPSGRPALVLATKIDKLNQSDRRAAVSSIGARLREAFPERAATTTVIPFSATLREGVDSANAILAEWLGGPRTEADPSSARGLHGY